MIELDPIYYILTSIMFIIIVLGIGYILLKLRNIERGSK